MSIHILYLHQYFVPPDGPGGTRSYEMARRLVKAGHKVTMLTSSASFPPHYNINKRVTNLEIDGIDLTVLNVSYSNKFSFWRRILAFINFSFGALVELSTLKKIDLVFATSTPLTIAIPGIFAKFRHRCPMVFEVRDLWPELPIAVGALRSKPSIWLAKKLEKLAYKSSSHVIALSPGMAEGVASSGFPSERIKIIPNSCDVDLFRVPKDSGEAFLNEYPQFKEGPLVLYAGTLGVINGVDYLAEIASEMLKIDTKIRFLIVGDGMEKGLVLKRAKDLNVLDNNLWIMPPFVKKDMPQLLSASSVAMSLFVDLPEMWNNSANKFFDALAAGRPVVINYSGWQAEFIEKSGAGLVIPARDSCLAAQRLRGFLYDKKRIEAARLAANKAAETTFNRDRLADDLRNLLEEAAKK